MTTLKSREIQKMNKEEQRKKLKELKLELVKSKVSASKTGSSRAKEIRKIIARILTFNKSDKAEEKSSVASKPIQSLSRKKVLKKE